MELNETESLLRVPIVHILFYFLSKPIWRSKVHAINWASGGIKLVSIAHSFFRLLFSKTKQGKAVVSGCSLFNLSKGRHF